MEGGPVGPGRHTEAPVQVKVKGMGTTRGLDRSEVKVVQEGETTSVRPFTRVHSERPKSEVGNHS